MSLFTQIMDSIKQPNQVQPDWNQNIESESDYIKNRPFYESVEDEVIFDGTITTVEDESYYFESRLDLVSGDTYSVTLNGVEYEVVAYYDDTDSMNCLALQINDTEWVNIYQNYFWAPTLSGNQTLKIVLPNKVTINKLEEKYLPECALRSDVKQKFTDVEKSQVRENIEALSIADISNNLIWYGTATGDRLGRIVVKLENPKGFELKNGVCVVVRSMPCVINTKMQMGIGYGSMYDIRELDGGKLTTSWKPWTDGTVAVFQYYNKSWYYLPVNLLATTIHYGFTRLSNMVTSDSDDWAATSSAVKKAYDKAVEALSVAEEAKEMIITSSTEGSNKKFKVTVDDFGKLTAVEITE